MADHLLLLPDVLFQIVPYLDFFTLLDCQRVCRTWNSIISQSREAKQALFLETDHKPFHAFKAAEEHDIAQQLPPAFIHPQQRIPCRPEFRALFNPWIDTHDLEPICQPASDPERAGFLSVGHPHRPLPTWRFTDRVSSGRLEFCYTPCELVTLVDQTHASWNKMFLTQPPVKRVLVTVQGGYRAKEDFDVEKEEGVRIGDIIARVRDSKAARVMRATQDKSIYTTIDLGFDEHFTGTRFLALQRLFKDEYGNVHVTTV